MFLCIAFLIYIDLNDFFLGLNKTEQFDKKFHIIHAYENRSANDLKPVKID